MKFDISDNLLCRAHDWSSLGHRPIKFATLTLIRYKCMQRRLSIIIIQDLDQNSITKRSPKSKCSSTITKNRMINPKHDFTAA